MKKPLVCAGLALLLPVPALAHSSIAGINHFYSGFLHPLFVPPHLILLLAISLLLGQQAHRLAEVGFGLYMIGLSAALLLAGVGVRPDVQVLLLITAMAAGALVALGRPLFRLLCLGLSLLAGLFIGVDSAHETLTGNDKWMSLLGSGLGVFFFSLYPLMLADYVKKTQWQQIAVRVLGSWIAAASILVLALSIAAVGEAG